MNMEQLLNVDYALVAMAGLGAFLCVVAIGNWFIERDRFSSRIKVLKDRRTQLRGEMMATKRRKKKPEGSVNMMRSFVTKLKLLKKSDAGTLEDRLFEAGFRSRDAVFVFSFFNFVLPVIGLVIGVMLFSLHYEGVVAQKFKIVWPILFTYIGYKLPGYVVNRKRKQRYSSLRAALADTLDLLTICSEAGLSLAASLDRVSRELSLAYPDMAEEIGLTSIELGFLPNRNQALLNLAERVRMEEVRGIVNVLIQTEKYGTPITQALRVLSSEFREQRMLRAEQKAARLPAVMTVPMIAFILPTLFIVILAPVVIRVMDSSF